MAHLDLVRVRVSTVGAGGPLALGAADGGGRTFAAAGAVDGETYSYALVDGLLRETGTGIYSAGGQTLTRIFGASTTGSPLALSGNAVLEVTALSADFDTARAPTRVIFNPPLTTWIVNHNLGRDVQMTAHSMGGVDLMAEIMRISGNQVQVYFDEPTAGYVLYV